MHILYYNFSWMWFNLYLAVLPLIFCWLFFRIKNKFFKYVFGFLWLLYLPNSIYIFTDLHHLIEQWGRVSEEVKVLLAAQYIIFEAIGLAAFIVGFAPLERFFRPWQLITLNFLFGFAMVLGKVERVNSWDIFTDLGRVINSIIHIISSIELLGLVLLFGLFSNFFYFLFKDSFSGRFQMILLGKKN